MGNTQNNLFVCQGKYAGSYRRRATPGGLLLEDIVVAVTTKVPWKQKKLMHIKMTCCGECVDLLKKIKVGEEVRVEGVIDQTGRDDFKDLKLIATKLEKGEIK